MSSAESCTAARRSAPRRPGPWGAGHRRSGLGRGDLLLDVLVDPASTEETLLLALASLPPDAVEEGIRRVVAVEDAGRLWRGAGRSAGRQQS